MGTEVANTTSSEILAAFKDSGGEGGKGNAVAAMLAKMAAKTASQSATFLIFDTKGGLLHYKDGGKRVIIREDAEIAVNVLDVKNRWTCWKESKPVESFDLAVYEDAPDQEDLDKRAEAHGIDRESCEDDPDCSDGWSDAVVIPVKILGEARQFEFLASNMTLKNAVGKLLQTLAEQAVTNDVDDTTPIVSFTVDSYKSKSGFTVYYPVFKVEDWRDNAELGAVVPAKKPKAKKQGKIAAKD